jgi:hypothetical protein
VGSYFHAGYIHDRGTVCDSCTRKVAEAALKELGVAVTDPVPAEFYGDWSWPVSHGRYADAEVAAMVGRWMHAVGDDADVPTPDEWYYSDKGQCVTCGVDLN